MFEFVLFPLGFLLLLKGADYLIDGAVALAEKLRVSSLFTGLTVVALGTSLPEFFVNLFSAISGNGGISLGNIIGSNIANTLLILGFLALLSPLSLNRSLLRKEIPFCLLASAILILLANDQMISNQPSLVSRTDGIVLLAFFLLFLYYLYTLFRKTRAKEKLEKVIGIELPEVKPKDNLTILLFLLAGVAGLFFGGQWVVDGARAIAEGLGLTTFLISATLIGLGTSFPELMTSVLAIVKKKQEIALGNIFGSNIFNIFFVLGFSSLISPIPFSFWINFDLFFLFGSTLLLLGLVAEKLKLDRKRGSLLLALYILYIVLIISREVLA